MDIPIIRLKKLPESNDPFPYAYIQFLHCYKQQTRFSKVLSHFQCGKGALYDIEFFTMPQPMVCCLWFPCGFHRCSCRSLSSCFPAKRGNPIGIILKIWVVIFFMPVMQGTKLQAHHGTHYIEELWLKSVYQLIDHCSNGYWTSVHGTGEPNVGYAASQRMSPVLMTVLDARKFQSLGILVAISIVGDDGYLQGGPRRCIFWMFT